MNETEFSNLLNLIKNRANELPSTLVLDAISIEQLGFLLDALQTNDRITGLTLTNSHLVNAGVRLLAAWLSRLPQIKFLHLENCMIAPEDEITLDQIRALFCSARPQRQHQNQKVDARMNERLERVLAYPETFLINEAETLNDLILKTQKAGWLVAILIPYILRNNAWFDFYVKTMADLNRFIEAYPIAAKEAVERFFPQLGESDRLRLTLGELAFYRRYVPDLTQSIIDQRIGTYAGFCDLILDTASFLQLADSFPASAEQLLPTILNNNNYFLQVIRSLTDICQLIQRFPAYKINFYHQLRHHHAILLTNPFPTPGSLTEIMQSNPQIAAIVIPFLLNEWRLFNFYIRCNRHLMDFLKAFPAYGERILSQVAHQDRQATGFLISTASELCRCAKFDPVFLKEWVQEIFAHENAFFRFFTDLTSFLQFSRTFPETAATLLNRISTERHYFFHLIRSLNDLEQLSEQYPPYRLGFLAMLDNNRDQLLAMITDFEALLHYQCLATPAETNTRAENQRQLLEAIIANQAAFVRVAATFFHLIEFLKICQSTENTDLIQCTVARIFDNFSQHNGLVTTQAELHQLIVDFPDCADIIFVGLLSNTALWAHFNLDSSTRITNLFPTQAAYQRLDFSLADVHEQLRQAARFVKEQRMLRQQSRPFSFFSGLSDEPLQRIAVYSLGPDYQAIKPDVLFDLFARFLAQDDKALGCATTSQLLENELNTSKQRNALAINLTASLAFERYWSMNPPKGAYSRRYEKLVPKSKQFTLARIKEKLTLFAQAVLSECPTAERGGGYLNRSLRKAIIARFGEMTSIADVRNIETAIMDGFQDYLNERGLKREAFGALPAGTADWGWRLSEIQLARQAGPKFGPI